MASSTTYLSFTSEGGRIAWSNGDEDTWGHVRWDRWWPRNPPTPAEAAEAAAFLAKTMKAMGASIRQATEAARALAAAMGNDRQPNREEATDQPAPSVLLRRLEVASSGVRVPAVVTLAANVVTINPVTDLTQATSYRLVATD